MKRCWICFVTFCCAVIVSAEDGGVESFSIAAVADVQYADERPRGGRQPAEGVKRLTHAISEWNRRDLDWGVMLGDVIDWDDIDYRVFPHETKEVKPFGWTHTKAVLAVWKTLEAPKHIVLGNHDYYVPEQDSDGLEKPASVYRAFGVKEGYYQFSHKGFRFVVLEGDVSPLNFATGSEAYKKAKAYYDAVQGRQKVWWNAGISEEQLGWLEEVLNESAEKEEPTVLMCHYPIHEPIDSHSLLNAKEVSALLDQYPQVVLWLNGHNHKGAYKQVGKRHHLNLKGMQNGGRNWYEIQFSPSEIKVFQAEAKEKAVYVLPIEWGQE